MTNGGGCRGWPPPQIALRAGASVHCRRRKAEREHHPAAGIVVHRDGALMCLHDLGDDRKAETRPAGTFSLAAPEPFEHVTPLIPRDAGATVRDAHGTIGRRRDHYLAPGSGVSNRVLDQISDRIANRVSVPSHDDRRVVTIEGDGFVL